MLIPLLVAFLALTLYGLYDGMRRHGALILFASILIGRIGKSSLMFSSTMPISEAKAKVRNRSYAGFSCRYLGRTAIRP